MSNSWWLAAWDYTSPQGDSKFVATSLYRAFNFEWHVFIRVCDIHSIFKPLAMVSVFYSLSTLFLLDSIMCVNVDSRQGRRFRWGSHFCLECPHWLYFPWINKCFWLWLWLSRLNMPQMTTANVTISDEPNVELITGLSLIVCRVTQEYHTCFLCLQITFNWWWHVEVIGILHKGTCTRGTTDLRLRQSMGQNDILVHSSRSGHF